MKEKGLGTISDSSVVLACTLPSGLFRPPLLSQLYAGTTVLGSLSVPSNLHLFLHIQLQQNIKILPVIFIPHSHHGTERGPQPASVRNDVSGLPLTAWILGSRRVISAGEERFRS